VDHVYKAEGAVAVQLVVVDRQGGVSAPALVGVKIGDGTPPVVVITSPPANRTFPLTTTTTKTVTKTKVKTRRRARIGFGGTAKDPSGVTAVYVSLQRLAKATTTAKTSAAKTKPTTCTWLDPKQGLVVRDCRKPILLKARVRSSKWAYILAKKIQLGAGSYRVSAYGTDGTGAFGNSAPTRRRVVRFKLTG
jgi:hypothetical protein